MTYKRVDIRKQNGVLNGIQASSAVLCIVPCSLQSLSKILCTVHILNITKENNCNKKHTVFSAVTQSLSVLCCCALIALISAVVFCVMCAVCSVIR